MASCSQPPRARATALAVALVLAAAARAAGAQEAARPVRDALRVEGTGCLERAALADQIGGWLGRDRLDARIEITVREAPDLVAYRVRRDGADVGERTLRLRRRACPDLRAAVGLAIAIAIDAAVLDTIGAAPPAPGPPAPEAGSVTPGATPLPAPPPAPAPFTPALPPPPPPLPLGPPPMPFVPPPPPPRRPEPEARLAIAAQGVVLVGVLPEVSLGFAPSADLTVTRWLDLRASGIGTTTVRAEVGTGAAEVSLVGGRLDACGVRRAGPARFRGCLGLIAGAIAAQGVDVPSPRDETAAWLGPAARIDARWGFGRTFGLLFSLDGFFAAVRPELYIQGRGLTVAAEESFPLAGVTLGLGPSIAF